MSDGCMWVGGGGKGVYGRMCVGGVYVSVWWGHVCTYVHGCKGVCKCVSGVCVVCV